MGLLSQLLTGRTNFFPLSLNSKFTMGVFSSIEDFFGADVSTIHGQRGGAFISVQIHYKQVECAWIGSVWLAVYESDEVAVHGAEQVWLEPLRRSHFCSIAIPIDLHLFLATLAHPPLLSAPCSALSHVLFQWGFLLLLLFYRDFTSNSLIPTVLPKLWLLYCHYLLSSSHMRQQQLWPPPEPGVQCTGAPGTLLSQMLVMFLQCESSRTWPLTAVVLQSFLLTILFTSICIISTDRCAHLRRAPVITSPCEAILTTGSFYFPVVS